MVLWIAMAVLAAAAAVPLLAALGRPTSAPSASAQAMAIYRDQLDEVERDVARGVVAPGDADAARTEIARRLIRAGDVAAMPPSAGGRRRAIATTTVVAMPILALGLYLAIGSPLDPDQPLASRPDAVALQDVRKLVAQVEAHLAVAPDDGKGWEVVAPVYARLGRPADAVHAWSRAIELLGSTIEREVGLGEAMIAAGDGVISPDAVTVFERARALAPDDPRPRFYLARALGQAGRIDDAKAAWQSLLRDAPKDAPWLPAATAELAALEKAPGADAQLAASLSAEQRQQMIESMVASLADKLKADPSDADGWARLIRSYMVLGRPDDARAAWASAEAAFADDAAKRATVAAAARDAGLTEATQ